MMIMMMMMLMLMMMMMMMMMMINSLSENEDLTLDVALAYFHGNFCINYKTQLKQTDMYEIHTGVHLL